MRFFRKKKKKKYRRKYGIPNSIRINRSARVLLILNDTWSIVFFHITSGTCRTRFFQSPPIRRLISCHKKVLATTGATRAEMITGLQSDSHKSAENRLPSPLTPPKRSSYFLLRCVIFKFRFNILFFTPCTHHPLKIPIDSDSLIQLSR